MSYNAKSFGNLRRNRRMFTTSRLATKYVSPQTQRIYNNAAATAIQRAFKAKKFRKRMVKPWSQRVAVKKRLPLDVRRHFYKF